MRNKWDERYLLLAEHVGGWSKDPSTKVGAVVIGEHGQVLSQGYNGFPRGIEDTEERLHKRELKYELTVHAEMNAIFNATLTGVSLKGGRLFIHGLPPCHKCAPGIIQSGIAEVVYVKRRYAERWKDSCEMAKSMLLEANVRVRSIPLKK